MREPLPPSPHDYLRVPYVLESRSIERADGTWARRADYIELPGCAAEAESIIDAIDAADILRVRLLLRMWRDGDSPPLPRMPLPGLNVSTELRRLGLRQEYEDALRTAGVRNPASR
jgi:hypothetical protein